jgi:HK97 family phage portal protein
MKLKFWEKDEPKAATLKEPEWWRQSINIQPVDAGVAVNQATAMQLSAFFACVRILSESIGSLPLKVYMRRSDGGKELAVNHPLNRLFSQVANPEMTPQELLEFVMASALIRGTAYCRKEYNNTGQIVGLHPLDPAYMRVTRDSADKLIFAYEDPKRRAVYMPSEIWRVPAMGGDGVTGYSTLSHARQSLGVAIATERHAAKTFANGTRIPSVFEMDGHLREDAKDRLTQDLRSYMGSENAGKTLILESGLKYKQIGMSNDDAQFLQSRKFQVAEIARWFRVPLHMLNELDRATFSNIEHQSIEFVMHTLRPWCKRIEHTITRDLIPARYRGLYFAEFTLDALLRGDTESRYNAYAVGIQNGWLSRNDVRKKENMNPVDGLDEYLVPLNMAGANDEPEDDEDDVQAKLDGLIAREVKAIRVEYDRLPPEDFREWVGDFYLRFIDTLIDEGVDEQTAEGWANHRRDKVLAVADVPALMDEWEGL